MPVPASMPITLPLLLIVWRHRYWRHPWERSIYRRNLWRRRGDWVHLLVVGVSHIPAVVALPPAIHQRRVVSVLLLWMVPAVVPVVCLFVPVLPLPIILLAGTVPILAGPMILVSIRRMCISVAVLRYIVRWAGLNH